MAKLVYLKDINRERNSVITVGTFDGVHAGHRVLMETVKKKAQKADARSVIVTFDPHPREIINPGDAGIKLLTTLPERREILEEVGIDVLLVIPFNRDFSLLTAEEFVRDIIYEKVGVSEFVIGYDHHFGRDREGTIETVERLGNTLGFDAYVVSKQEVGDQTVSSTAIRNAISKEGNMQKAAGMLRRTYRLSGTVVHGDKRGQKIGFPTANISPNDNRKIIPKDGVYAVKVKVEGEPWRGMMNIGQRPTFEGKKPALEVHIFGFDKTIYGMTIEIEFIKRIRDEKKFEGVDELIAQLEEDKKQSVKILEEL
jgi:riboflavin kinase/FMN adenylyltransferase